MMFWGGKSWFHRWTDGQIERQNKTNFVLVLLSTFHGSHTSVCVEVLRYYANMSISTLQMHSRLRSDHSAWPTSFERTRINFLLFQRTTPGEGKEKQLHFYCRCRASTRSFAICTSGEFDVKGILENQSASVRSFLITHVGGESFVSIQHSHINLTVCA